jgi:butyryl-CoA dehydrogenase
MIIEHADVRRMLLRQKAIVEGAMSLVVATARYVDLSEHATDEAERAHARVMLDLLTPIAKTFPAEKGYESNALAVQIHGGYGYTSEYLPEAWLRDQKLNSIHEGTTGIQSADLLGRKLGKLGQASMTALHREVRQTLDAARAHGVDAMLCDGLEQALTRVTAVLIKITAERDPERMLSHSVDVMDMFSTFIIAWQWLVQLTAAQPKLRTAPDDDFLRGKQACAQYWFRTELPRIDQLATLIESLEDSYLSAKPGWF